MQGVWLHQVGAGEFPAITSLSREFREVGIEIVEWNESRRGIGVVIVRTADFEAEDFVRRASRAGTERVIVAVPRACVAAQGWRLLCAGASDLVGIDEAGPTIRDLVSRVERWRRVDEILDSPLVRENLVGRSSAWLATLRQVIEVARFTSNGVLIVGESGTGKELLAQLIHTLDPRPDKRDLVLLDCTTLAKDLSGSELFGHERGAFTGAHSARDGVFALADGGTLFLDEIGELPLPLQAQLLRAVQERTYKRVGGNAWQRVNFRLVCATNRNLLEAVERGEFRRDLYYRIAGWCCTPPPLRDRADDVLLLAEHFLAQHRDGARITFDPIVRDHLVRRSYPGNVRDLRQLVQRVAGRHVGDGPVTVGSLPMEEWPRDPASATWEDTTFEGAIRRAVTMGASLREISRAAAEAAVRVALDDAEGNLQRAARQLGVTDRALQMRRASRKVPIEELDA